MTVIVGGWPLSYVWAQTVTTSVDRNPVYVEETVKLVVTFKGGNPDGSPDLSVLQEDFEILGTAQSTRTSMMNGKMDTTTEWVSTLVPKHEGSITIPPIRIRSAASAPLTLKVLPAGQTGTPGRTPDVFLDVEVTPTNPYVQSQVTMIVRLYHAIPLREGRLDDPNAKDLVVQKLGEDRAFETLVDGRRYSVIERQYALFPQRSGTLTIPSLAFTGQVPDHRGRRLPFDNFFGNRSRGFPSDPFDSLFQSTRPVRTRSQTVTINVRPIPPASASEHWLPAKHVELRETWAPEHVDQEKLHVGDPITRTITVMAKGLTGAQLPDLPLPETDKVKTYPDQAVTETKTEGTTTIGLREQKVAFVPSEAGAIHLPAIELPWWDVAANQRRVAHLPAKTLIVLPEPGSVQPAGPGIPAIENRKNAQGKAKSRQAVVPGDPQVAQPSWPRWWQGATGLLFLLWMGTLGGWWYDRRRRMHQIEQAKAGAKMGATHSLKEAKKACEQACRAHDPKQTKEQVLRWASIKWSTHPPLGIAGVAQRLSDSQAQDALWELDRCLYAPENSSWDGNLFWLRLSEAMDNEDKPSSPSKEVLPPLYVTPSSRS